MKKSLLIILALTLLMGLVLPISPSLALTDLLIFDQVGMIGAVTEALMTEDGMLIAGGSEFDDHGWIADLHLNGSVRWVLPEARGGIYKCLAPAPGGGYRALMRWEDRPDDYGDWNGRNESWLSFISMDGAVTHEVQLADNTVWLLTDAAGSFALSNQYGVPLAGTGEYSATYPTVTRLDSDGEMVWSYPFSSPAYSDLTYAKAVWGGDSLIIMGQAFLAETGDMVGVIERMNLDGEVIEHNDITMGSDTVMSDICLTAEGTIAAICSTMTYDEAEGYPTDRSCSVFTLDAEGNIAWDYEPQHPLMLDWIMPVKGGLLLASRGLNLHEDPNLGEGWLLLLDAQGRLKASQSTPFIGGGLIELYGLAKNGQGEALLMGAMLDEPGYPGQPFITRLDFPEAYQ